MRERETEKEELKGLSGDFWEGGNASRVGMRGDLKARVSKVYECDRKHCSAFKQI